MLIYNEIDQWYYDNYLGNEQQNAKEAFEGIYFSIYYYVIILN